MERRTTQKLSSHILLIILRFDKLCLIGRKKSQKILDMPLIKEAKQTIALQTAQYHFPGITPEKLEQVIVFSVEGFEGDLSPDPFENIHLKATRTGVSYQGFVIATGYVATGERPFDLAPIYLPKSCKRFLPSNRIIIYLKKIYSLIIKFCRETIPAG
jgi:hypothetical protein